MRCVYYKSGQLWAEQPIIWKCTTFILFLFKRIGCVCADKRAHIQRNTDVTCVSTCFFLFGCVGYKHFLHTQREKIVYNVLHLYIDSSYSSCCSANNNFFVLFRSFSLSLIFVVVSSLLVGPRKKKGELNK